MNLVRRNSIADLFGLNTEMDRYFDRFFSPDMFDGSTLPAGSWLPNMDVVENSDGFVLNLDLPGMSKKDINITLENDALTIKGERTREEENKDVNYHRVERLYGSFVRSFRLPKLVKQDSIQANFKNGVLSISIPKAEEVKPKAIEVKVS